MTTVQGELAPIYLSVDGIVWKTLVCLETYSLGLTTTINQVETNCGLATGLGVVKFAPTGSAVMEAAPDGTQVTQSDMVGWQLAKTLLYFKTEYPLSGSQYGKNVSLSGQAYVTDVSITMQVGQVIKFTWKLSGNGQISNIPE